MKLGYNTNGFAHHRLPDAIRILGELGYRSVAITLDYHALNPFAPDPQPALEEVKRLLTVFGMNCVIETGARFLLDPYRKHQPTLLDADPGERDKRMGMLLRAIDYAHYLRADAVSFWSGKPTSNETIEVYWQRLINCCTWLTEQAALKGVRLAFEPEPGMFISRMEEFSRLHREVNHSHFGLTLDVGHVHCLNDGEIPAIIEEWKPYLWNIHIEDMRPGVHEHLFFGEGTMEFTSIAKSLHTIKYQGGLHVELSRHSHDAVTTAEKARDFLIINGFDEPATKVRF